MLIVCVKKGVLDNVWGKNLFLKALISHGTKRLVSLACSMNFLVFFSWLGRVETVVFPFIFCHYFVKGHFTLLSAVYTHLTTHSYYYYCQPSSGSHLCCCHSFTYLFIVIFLAFFSLSYVLSLAARVCVCMYVAYVLTYSPSSLLHT